MDFSLPLIFFFPVLKVTNTFVLHVNGSCGVHGVRTTPVCDVTTMYSKERYMENVPLHEAKRVATNTSTLALERPVTRRNAYQSTFFPHTITLWNSLSPSAQNCLLKHFYKLCYVTIE